MPSIAFLAAFALACTPTLHALLCNMTGTFVDESNNVAALTEDASLALNATSITEPNSWTTALGAVSRDSTTAWMVFGASNLTASISATCTVLSWSNGATWTRSQSNANVTTVHAVFMTHLDVGFTNLAKAVCEQYFFEHFPNGIALAASLRAAGGPAAYAVTSHPWLILEYLDGAAGCSYTPRNASMIALMEGAIARGDVRWHAKPMNNFVELEDGAWFDSSLTLAKALNARFNTSWGTVTAKSTDVPGMSRSSIPHFAAAGVRALHIGYNSACRVPEIPMAFNWVHEGTGTQLLVFVNNNYGSTIWVPGSSHALAFFYSPDNSGPPPSASAVQSWWASTQARFPQAELLLSSLDAFAEAILPLSEALPQVTGEIGMSWSYGAPGDPLKLAAVRATRRVRNAAVTDGWLDPLDANLAAFERRQWVGGPEHNWGLSFGQYLGAARSPNGNWSNELFHALRYRPDYAFIESGNIEKRDFSLPIDPPPMGPPSEGYSRFVAQAADAVLALQAAAPDMSLYAPVDASGTFGPCGRFSSVAFSPTDGSIISLVDAGSSYEWVAPGGFLGAFSYKTYTEGNFNQWNEEYNPGCGPPCPDFAKPGMDSASPVNATWLPSLTGLYRLKDGSCGFIATLALDDTTVTQYGGMSSIFLNYILDTDWALASAPTLQVELTWLNKTATRLAESSWLGFRPNVGPSSDNNGTTTRWAMDILGHPVSPLEVVEMGTRHLHAVDTGVSYDARDIGGAYLNIEALDTPLVAPGDTEHLLWYDGLSQPDLSGGWHFVLHDNLWGTAFPQWYGDDGLFRFVLSLQAPQA